MMSEKKTRQPLSSASEIMSRHHDRKKRKWYKNLLKGHSKEVDCDERGIQPPDKIISKSLENVGNFNLTVMGFPVRASSFSNVINNDDAYSVSSTSSNESDTSERTTPEHTSVSRILDRRKLEPYSRKFSFHSSDSETSTDMAPIWQDFNASGGDSVDFNNAQVESSKDSGFSFYSYLPFTWGSTPMGSWESVCSQPEDKKALVHLIHNSDSEQV